MSDRPLKVTKQYSSAEEIAAYRELNTLLEECPIPPNEILGNLSLFLSRAALSQLLFIDDLYRRILDVHGVIMEFGVRWGRNLALYATLRSIYEPHNFSRKIVGFDTFSGFPSVAPEDGSGEAVSVGTLSVSAKYENYLERILRAHERLAPRSHLKKFELVQGNVIETMPGYLEKNPETIVALAYFDFDLYEPTKEALSLLKNRLTKGSVIAFDELVLHEFPGETVAVMEMLGLRNTRIQRTPHSHYQSFTVVE